MNISIRELRAILFDINDQELTIKELRAILFSDDNQDITYTIAFDLAMCINKLDRSLHKYITAKRKCRVLPENTDDK